MHAQVSEVCPVPEAYTPVVKFRVRGETPRYGMSSPTQPKATGYPPHADDA